MRIWVAALLLVTACGAVPEQGSGSLPQPSAPDAALVKWASFPANARPRPIIIFNRTVEHIGPAGFTSEPDRKRDWGCNKFALAPGVALPRTAPDRATAQGAVYPSIDAERAYRELIAARGRYAAANPECSTSTPFAIKAVRWATAGFQTDRGTMTMSAWVFEVAEIEAYLAYSALDPSAFFGGGATEGSSEGVRVSADGLTLRIRVSNAGPGKCDYGYSVATAESATAVSYAVRQFSHASPGESVICTLPLWISYIAAPLRAPLGGRVVVDAAGEVAGVCPEVGDC
jgi:hypothetical protein